MTPETLMGEGGMCGLWAMVALAQLAQANANMYGHDDNPSVSAYLAFILWPYMPDLTKGAHYVFSTSDLALDTVQKIIKDKDEVMVWPCQGGLELHFY